MKTALVPRLRNAWVASMAVVALVLAGRVAADDSGVTLASLKQREKEIQQVVDKVLPCTVCVRSANGMGSGSGVVVSRQGLVLTAAHVTMAAGEDLIVIFPDGHEVKAKALGRNRVRDAGMAKIVEKGEYPFAKTGSSKDLEKNQWCISLGHAGGFDPQRTPPVRLGRILGNDQFLTTDCALIGGDSGGPLFDLSGRVIGIHSNIGQSLALNRHVPIDAFRDDWKRLRRGETWGSFLGIGMDPDRPVLGIQLKSEPADDGVAIAEIVPNSPAAKAGLKAGDVIEKVDGKKVTEMDQVISRVGRKKAGDEVVLHIHRGEETLDITAKLAKAGDLMRRQRPRPKPEEEKPAEDKPAGDKPAEEKTAPPAEAQQSDDEAEEPNEEPKDESAEDDGDVKQDEKDDSEDLSLEELLRRAQRNGGRLQMTPEQFRRFREEMRKQGARMGFRPAAPAEKDDWYEQVIGALKPVVAPAGPSTARVLVDDKQVALATIVDAEGRLLTKASEIEGKDFEIEIAPKDRREGKVVRRFEQYDLALVEVSGEKLKPVAWYEPEDRLRLGTMVVSVDAADEPVAIGVVSVQSRSLAAAAHGFLGVGIADGGDGVKLTEVQKDSPAAEAGLKVGDVIVAVDGKAYASPAALAQSVGSRKPGETVTLKVRREKKELQLKAKLGERSKLLGARATRFDMMNRMGTQLSQNRSGYELALQHDCPLEPKHCGGPLVDLDGRVVGINVARAGRVKSYAIPSSVVRKLLESAE